MSCINESTAAAWRDIAAQCSKVSPMPGKRVRVTAGRKHLGKEGVVLQNIRSKFDNPYRYANEASSHVLDMERRRGYAVRIENALGGTFWVNASSVEVLDSAALTGKAGER